MTDGFAIGMDLGGTNARAAAVDAAGRLLAVHKQPVTSRDPNDVATVLASCTNEVLAKLGQPLSAARALGIGIAGQVDPTTDRVIVAPQFGWRDVDIAGPLLARFGRPVLVGNDLDVAALGEAKAGAARGYADALLVFVGSGVGSGLIIRGRNYRGSRGIAGEFGHIKVRPGGRLCGCGERGCLEAYAGGHNLGAQAAEAMAAGRATSLVVPPGLKPTASMIEIAAEQGDPLSVELRTQAAELVGVATANLVTMLNPSVLILGGGVLFGSPWMRRRVEEIVRENGARAAIASLLIVDPALGDDAGVIGAAFLGQA